MPAQFSRLDLIAAFCEIFSIILPDALNVLRQGMSEPRIDECQIDALDAFCVRLNDRLLVHRVSDREMMNNISEIARKIALLDDPTGQFRSQQPRLYAANCKGCHIIGYSQLKHLQELKFPVRLELLCRTSLLLFSFFSFLSFLPPQNSIIVN